MKSGIKVLTSLLVISVMGFMLIPVCGCGSGKGRALRLKCANNLKQISMAAMAYSEDNGGIYPDSLQTLVDQDYLTHSTLICPGDSRSDSHSYDYHAKSYLNTAQSPETIPIVSDKKSNHDDFVNTAYMDGHVESKSD